MKAEFGNIRPRRSYSWLAWPLLAIIAIYNVALFLRKGGDTHPPNLSRGEIEWHKCDKYSELFECGTLIAPLDYTNSDDERNASIALIRYKAGGAVPTPRNEVLGSLILNPGGPGGSGVNFLTLNNNNKSTAGEIDRNLNGRYDLVSFDPRGIGSTWPKVRCFNDSLENLVFSTIWATNGLPGDRGKRSQKQETGTLIAEQELLSDVCFNHEDAELFRFVSTPFVVRDMQLLHRALGDDKLHYWGFSYGSVIGTTYADMFPEDVGRVIVDGVVDVPNYYDGLWSNNFVDIEAVFDGFFDECLRAPDYCKLASLANSGAELKAVVLDWAHALKTRPISVAAADPPQILTYSTIIEKLFSTLYAPSRWPELAANLYQVIAENNPLPIVDHIDLQRLAEIDNEAGFGIMCGDVLHPPATNTTVWRIEDYERYIKPIAQDSPHFAHFFGQLGLMCRGTWKTRGAERHFGNFTSKTAFPIFTLGNEYDPVTPGQYAKKMANLFPEAVSVQRQGYGHCSFSQPSKCIDKVVREYFVDGRLPPPGTVCDVDSGPFEPYEPSFLAMNALFY